MAIADIKPAAINDVVYGVIDPNDPSLDELVRQLSAPEGQLDPVVLTLDNVLLSGHRRRAGGIRLGWKTLKAFRYPILSTDPQFQKLLVSYNVAQRDKSPGVRVREQLVLTDPAKAHEALISERLEASEVKAETLNLGAVRTRHRITAAKKPFLDAIRGILDRLKHRWPLTDRKVHYELLNDPPLRHANKPDTYRDSKGQVRHNRYRNDKESYKATCELLTRARLAGLIPFEAIGDETRPVGVWNVHPNVSPFIRRQVDRFGKGYHRDLMQDQPNHVEIVGEKMTVEAVVREIAGAYCIPYTIGRGYSSLPPLKAMYDRYKRSGKEKLVILTVSDHDPEGWNIPEVFAKTMRDDFGVVCVEAVKVALKPEQVRELNLPPNVAAKKSSSRYKEFVKQFGEAAYELEAAPDNKLSIWLDEAVRSVIDMDLYNDQYEQEERDAATLSAFTEAAVDHLTQLEWDTDLDAE